VTADCLKVTVYFGERDRHEGRFLADELLDLFERAHFRAAILLRGTEGFGIKHRLQTQRILSLSEDLPIVAIGVDTRDRVEQLLDQLKETVSEGLLTVERARMLTDDIGGVDLPPDLEDATKLTVYCGRSETVRGRPVSLAIVDRLHRAGVAGATVLEGVDGLLHGERQRGKFFSRNLRVPAMVVSVGSGEIMRAVIPELADLLVDPLITLERVIVLKRDGKNVAALPDLTGEDEHGLAVWQKLTVFASEQAHYDGHPLYVQLVRRLRGTGASGATAVRGIWGYHGDHEPHGDRFFALRRRVPIVTIAVDRPEHVRRWWPVLDEVTRDTGLVTSEVVPASRAVGGGREHGGLRLARRHGAARRN
jgi:PII-like signaling protein